MNSAMRQLLAEAAVVAEGRAVDIGGDKTSHSKPGSTILSSPGRSTYDEMLRRFSRAYTDRDHEEVVRWARRELDTLKGRNRPKARNERTMVLREWEGTHYKDVAQVTCISERTVRRWREEAGVDASTGLRSWDAKFRRVKRAA